MDFVDEQETCVRTGIIELPLGPVDRSEAFTLLRSARTLLGDVTANTGRLYREGLINRIDAALAREPRPLPPPVILDVIEAAVVEGRQVGRL